MSSFRVVNHEDKIWSKDLVINSQVAHMHVLKQGIYLMFHVYAEHVQEF